MLCLLDRTMRLRVRSIFTNRRFSSVKGRGRIFLGAVENHGGLTPGRLEVSICGSHPQGVTHLWESSAARPPLFNAHPLSLIGATQIVKRLTTLIAAAITAVMAFAPTVAFAAAATLEANERKWLFGPYGFWWVIGVAGASLALYQAWQFFQWMESQPPGTEDMVRIAGYVRTGADAYLKQQYKVVGWVFLGVGLLLLWMALGLGVQSAWVPVAFLSGGFFSGLAGWFGMKTATLASNRTAAGAARSLNEGLQIAFRSGAVMGLTVVGLGLIDIMLWFFILYWVVPALGFKVISLEEITVPCFASAWAPARRHSSPASVVASSRKRPTWGLTSWARLSTEFPRTTPGILQRSLTTWGITWGT